MNTTPEVTLQSYLQTVYLRAKLDLKPTSACQLSVAVSMLNRWHGRPILLSELSPDLATDWLISLKAASKSPRTINGRRASLITLWRHAARKGLAMKFDLDDVPRFKLPKKLPTAWTIDEMRRLLPHIRYNWLKTFAAFMYETGCRLASATLLTWSDWQPEIRTMVLSAATSKTGIEQRVRVSKSTADAIDLLRPLIMDADAKIFPCPSDRRVMWREMRRALKAAGLPATRRDLFQKLRRTNATHTAANSSAEVAQRQLGHTSLRMTVENYIDPTFLPQVQAVDVLPPL